MPNIIIVSNDVEERELLKNKFIENGDEVIIKDFKVDPIQLIDETAPDMVVMDFSDPKTAIELTEKLVEFDSTTCVFGLINKDQDFDMSGYTSGARVIIRRKGSVKKEDDVVEIVNGIINSCNELTDGVCNACWETNRFVQLV